MLYSSFYTHCGHTRESAEQARARFEDQVQALAASTSIWGRIKRAITKKDRSKLVFVEGWCPACMSLRYDTGYVPFHPPPYQSVTTTSGPSRTQNAAFQQPGDAGHRLAPAPRATAETLSLLRDPQDITAVASLRAAQYVAQSRYEDSRTPTGQVNPVNHLTELQQLRFDLMNDSDEAFRSLHFIMNHQLHLRHGPDTCADCDAVLWACHTEHIEQQLATYGSFGLGSFYRANYDLELEAFLVADYWRDLGYDGSAAPPQNAEPGQLEEDSFTVGDDSDDEDVSPMTATSPNPLRVRNLLPNGAAIFEPETRPSTRDADVSDDEVLEDMGDVLDNFPFPSSQQSPGESSSNGNHTDLHIWSMRGPNQEQALASALSQSPQEQQETQEAGPSASRPDEVPDLPTQVSSPQETNADPFTAVSSQLGSMLEKYAKWDDKIGRMIAEGIARCPTEPDPAMWEPWYDLSRQIDAAIAQCDAIKSRAIADINAVEDQQANTLIDILDDEFASSLVGRFTNAFAGTTADSEENEISEEIADQEQEADDRIDGLENEFLPMLVEQSTDELAGDPFNSEEQVTPEEADQTATNIDNEPGANALTPHNAVPAENPFDDDVSDYDVPTKNPFDDDASEYENNTAQEDSDGESEGAGLHGFDNSAEHLDPFDDNSRFEEEYRPSHPPHVRDEPVELDPIVYSWEASIELPRSPSPPQSPSGTSTSSSSMIDPHTPLGQEAAQLVRSYCGVPANVPLHESSFFYGRPSFDEYFDSHKIKWKAPKRGKMHGRWVSQGPRGEYGLNVSQESWEYRCDVSELGCDIAWDAEPNTSVFEDSDGSDSEALENQPACEKEAEGQDQKIEDADDAVSNASSSSSTSSTSSVQHGQATSDPAGSITFSPLHASLRQQLEAVDEHHSEHENTVQAAFAAAHDELYDPFQQQPALPDEDVSPISTLSPVTPVAEDEPVYDGLIVQEVFPTEAEEELPHQPKERSSLRKELLDDGSF